MKRSLRDYLMTLCIAVLIFTVVAFFLIQAAEGLMGDVIGKIGSEGEVATQEEIGVSQTPSGGGSEPEQQKDAVATFLLMGVDQNKRQADAIFLVGINATKKEATVVLIPSNTVVPEGQNRYALGELYATKSVNYFQDFIAKETGVKPDYYAVMSMSALSNLIDFLGGIQYNVPENMYAFDPNNNFKINLQAGTRTLSGDQVLQLVSYMGYKNGKTGREDTQIGFARAFCNTFLTPDNLSRFKAIMYNIYYNVDTNFGEADLNALGDLIFRFSEYTQNFSRIPGGENGGLYTITSARAKALFESYQ